MITPFVVPHHLKNSGGGKKEWCDMFQSDSLAFLLPFFTCVQCKTAQSFIGLVSIENNMNK